MLAATFAESDYKGLDLHDEAYRYPIEDLGKFSHIDPDSSCFQYALGDALQRCRDVGVEAMDLETRKMLSVKLTLCEMTNLNLPFPSICTNNERTDDCIHSLEKVPQYWTLFSGNYREIRKICFEESLPFEKSQILKLYTNITKVFVKLHNDLATSDTTTSDQHNKLEKKFEELLKQVLILKNEIVLALLSAADGFSVVAENSQSVLQMSLDLMQSFTDENSMNLHELSVNMNFFNNQMTDMILAIENSGVRKSMDKLEMEIDKRMKDVVNNVDEVTNKVKLQMAGVNSYVLDGEILGSRLQQGLESSNELVTKITNILNNVESKALGLELISSDYVSQFLDDLFFGLEMSFHHFESKFDDYITEIDCKASETLDKIDKTNEAINSLFIAVQWWTHSVLNLFKKVLQIPIITLLVSIFHATNSILKKYKILWNVIFIISLVIFIYYFYFIRKKSIKKKKKKKPKPKKQFPTFYMLLSLYMAFYLWMVFLVVKNNFRSSPDFVGISYQ